MTKPGNEPGVITDLHDFLKWYMQTTLRFPKAHRVTLGDRIDNHLLDMIEIAVRARYARDKRQLLHTLNIKLVFRELVPETNRRKTLYETNRRKTRREEIHKGHITKHYEMEEHRCRR